MIGNGFGDNNVSFQFQSYYLVVRLGREPHGLDRAVVEVETELDAFVEGELRLPRAVDVRVLLGLHPALVVVQRRLDHSVTDRLHAQWSNVENHHNFLSGLEDHAHLGNDVFGVLGAFQVEFAGDVGEIDPGVGQRDGPDCRLDDVMAQPQDEGISVVVAELLRVSLQHRLKLFDVAGPHGFKGQSG